MIQQLLFEIPFILSEFGGFGQINCIPHADRIDNYVKSAGSLELVLKCAFTKLAKFTKKIALANAFIAPLCLIPDGFFVAMPRLRCNQE